MVEYVEADWRHPSFRATQGLDDFICDICRQLCRLTAAPRLGQDPMEINTRMLDALDHAGDIAILAVALCPERG